MKPKVKIQMKVEMKLDTEPLFLFFKERVKSLWQGLNILFHLRYFLVYRDSRS